MSSKEISSQLSDYLAAIGNCNDRSFYYPTKITSLPDDDQFVALDALVESVQNSRDVRAAMTLGINKYEPAVPALVALRENSNPADRGLIGTALCRITGDVSYLEVAEGSNVASMVTIDLLESVPGPEATALLARGLRADTSLVRRASYDAIKKQTGWGKYDTMPDGTGSHLGVLEQLGIRISSHDEEMWSLAATKIEMLISLASWGDESMYNDQFAITWEENDEIREVVASVQRTVWGPINVEKIAALDPVRRGLIMEMLEVGLSPERRVLDAPVACVNLGVANAKALIERAKTTQTEKEVRRELRKGKGNSFYPGSEAELHFAKFVEQCDIALGMLEEG
jgi:hypothetical protein